MQWLSLKYKATILSMWVWNVIAITGQQLSQISPKKYYDRSEKWSNNRQHRTARWNQTKPTSCHYQAFQVLLEAKLDKRRCEKFLTKCGTSFSYSLPKLPSTYFEYNDPVSSIFKNFFWQSILLASNRQLFIMTVKGEHYCYEEDQVKKSIGDRFCVIKIMGEKRGENGFCLCWRHTDISSTFSIDLDSTN